MLKEATAAAKAKTIIKKVKTNGNVIIIKVVFPTLLYSPILERHGKHKNLFNLSFSYAKNTKHSKQIK